MVQNRKKNKYKENREEGWTFIETLIVLGIILILTSSVGFMAVKYLDKARIVAARSQIETYELALDAYYLDCGTYPSDDQGLDALWQKPSSGNIPENWGGPYINKPVHQDPWGSDYQYLIPGESGLPFGLRSLGSDRSEGGIGNAADITSWAQ